MVEQSGIRHHKIRKERAEHAPRTDAKKPSVVDQIYDDVRTAERQTPNLDDGIYLNSSI